MQRFDNMFRNTLRLISPLSRAVTTSSRRLVTVARPQPSFFSAWKAQSPLSAQTSWSIAAGVGSLAVLNSSSHLFNRVDCESRTSQAQRAVKERVHTLTKTLQSLECMLFSELAIVPHILSIVEGRIVRLLRVLRRLLRHIFLFSPVCISAYLDVSYITHVPVGYNVSSPGLAAQARLAGSLEHLVGVDVVEHPGTAISRL